MDDTIKVYVIDKGRDCLYMLFRDPTTRKEICRSTGERTKAKAAKVAGAWEAELREGRYKPASKVTWAEFRQRYEDEVVTSLAANTATKVDTTFGHIENLASPARLADLTTERLSTWQTKLRDKGLSENTIKSYVAHLKAALNWAAEMGMLRDAPKFRTPQRVKGNKVMKGRPITAEEFERMLQAVPKADVKLEHVDGWRKLLRGLWLSGLRLSEAMALSWDCPGIMVDLMGRRPMFRIQAGSEKGHKDRLLPVAPEFAEMLLATPEAERRGPVFNPLTKSGTRPQPEFAGRMISTIGEKAVVKVDESDRKGIVKPKWASAHDCRRAFGLRWASRVMPAVLQQLMRHAQIETTLKYYVGNDAEGMADVLYAAVPKPPKVDSVVDSAVSDDTAESAQTIVAKG